MDASRIGMGAVLSQNSHLIAFFSKFSPKLLCASTYVMELFAIIVAVKKWCHYLLGHQFTIITDHRSLKELLTQVVQTPEQQMYMAHLIGYDSRPPSSSFCNQQKHLRCVFVAAMIFFIEIEAEATFMVQG